MMVTTEKCCISDDLVYFLSGQRYEEYVLNLMNRSTKVFNGQYSKVQEQSHGECDFIDVESNEKYDAKLPFQKEQVKILAKRKNHKPEIQKWLSELHEEIAEFSPLEIREKGINALSNTRLYSIMKQEIDRDKMDENIVFFFPFPLGIYFKDSYFSQFGSDFLGLIYEQLKSEVSLESRKIYAIHPSSERNIFVLRNLETRQKEYIDYDELGKFFSYEVVDINFKK